MQVTAVICVAPVTCRSLLLFAGCCCYLQVDAVILQVAAVICRSFCLYADCFFCYLQVISVVHAGCCCYMQVPSVIRRSYLLVYAGYCCYMRVPSVISAGYFCCIHTVGYHYYYYCCYRQVPAVVCRLLLFSAGYFCYMQVPAVVCRPPRFSAGSFCYVYAGCFFICRFTSVVCGLLCSAAVVTYRLSLIPEAYLPHALLVFCESAIGCVYFLVSLFVLLCRLLLCVL